MTDALISQNSSKFSPGTIVASTTHPYNEGLYSPIIAGDPLSLPPLMIIIEEIRESKTLFNEKTGEEISKQGSSQCRCMWYCTKKHDFTELWYPSRYLKVIQSTEDQLAPMSINISDLNSYSGKLVSFRTSKLEFDKKKSSLSFKNNSQESTPTIVPILNFVSPVMQIVQVMEAKKPDPKDTTYDSKTGKIKRHVYGWVAKCRWYNSDMDKTSEKIIPIDCLQEIILPDQNYLKLIQDSINKQSFLRNGKNLIKPLRIIYNNGEYSIRGFNYISNKVEDRDILALNDLTSIKHCFSDKAPMFNPETGEVLTIIDAINKAIAGGCFIKISYEKTKEKVTSRTLSNFRLFPSTDLQENPCDYLIGYCHLRKAKRTFVISKITELNILNLKFEAAVVL